MEFDELYDAVEKSQQRIGYRQEHIGKLIEDMDEIRTALTIGSAKAGVKAPKGVDVFMDAVLEFVAAGETLMESMEWFFTEGSDIIQGSDGPPEEQEKKWSESWSKRVSMMINSQD